MRLDEVRMLVKLLDESDVAEIEISRWWGKVRVSKTPSGLITMSNQNGAFVPQHAIEAAQQLQHSGPGSDRPVQLELAGGPELVVGGAAADKIHTIESPMVGTFYRAPAPDADPYVDTGQHVDIGQTVCIIEAMKLMNEIESDVRGRVVDVLVENTQPVEYGQPLVLVEIA